MTKELLKEFAKGTYEDFEKRFSFWLIFQEVDPDNCFSDEELKRLYLENKETIK